MSDARIAVGRHGLAVIVHVSGDFRGERLAQLRADMAGAVAHARLAVIDLQGVHAIDNAGIAVIVGLSREVCAEAPGRLILCGASPRIRELLTGMRLDRVFHVHEDVRAALEAEGLLDTEPQLG